GRYRPARRQGRIGSAGRAPAITRPRGRVHRLRRRRPRLHEANERAEGLSPRRRVARASPNCGGQTREGLLTLEGSSSERLQVAAKFVFVDPAEVAVRERKG